MSRWVSDNLKKYVTSLNTFGTAVFGETQDCACATPFILTISITSVWLFLFPKSKIHFKGKIWGHRGY